MSDCDLDEVDCAICMNSITNEVAANENGITAHYKLPECGHIFHTNCIISWFRQGSNLCPMCRTTSAKMQPFCHDKWKFRLLQEMDSHGHKNALLQSFMTEYGTSVKILRAKKRRLENYRRDAEGKYTDINKRIKELQRGITKEYVKIGELKHEVCAHAQAIIIPIHKTLFTDE
jgi:hypothetical protein